MQKVTPACVNKVREQEAMQLPMPAPSLALPDLRC